MKPLGQGKASVMKRLSMNASFDSERLNQLEIVLRSKSGRSYEQ